MRCTLNIHPAAHGLVIFPIFEDILQAVQPRGRGINSTCSAKTSWRQSSPTLKMQACTRSALSSLSSTCAHKANCLLTNQLQRVRRRLRSCWEARVALIALGNLESKVYFIIFEKSKEALQNTTETNKCTSSDSNRDAAISISLIL